MYPFYDNIRCCFYFLEHALRDSEWLVISELVISDRIIIVKILIPRVINKSSQFIPHSVV